MLKTPKPAVIRPLWHGIKFHPFTEPRVQLPGMVISGNRYGAARSGWRGVLCVQRLATNPSL